MGTRPPDHWSQKVCVPEGHAGNPTLQSGLVFGTIIAVEDPYLLLPPDTAERAGYQQSCPQTLRVQPLKDSGGSFHQRLWTRVSVGVGSGVVLFTGSACMLL